MTRAELIRAVGDALTHLDMIRFDLELDDPERPRLYAQRKELDALMDRLVDAEIDETTPIYAEAAEQLGELNDALSKTAKDLRQLGEALDKVNQVMGVVNQVVGAVLPVLPGL